MCEHHKDPGKQVFINRLCRSCTASEKSQKRQIEILRKLSERGNDYDHKRMGRGIEISACLSA